MTTQIPGRALAVLLALCSASAAAAPADISIDLRGRFHADAAYYDEDDVRLDNGFSNRASRIGVTGKLDEWSILIEYDFAENGTTANDVKLGRTIGPGTLSIGHFKLPMGLSEQTSSNTLPFMERSSANSAILDGRRLGVGYDFFTDDHGVQAMVYGRAIGGRENGDMPMGIAARVFLSPSVGVDGRLHVAVSAAYEDRQDYGTVRYRDRPEVRPDGNRLIDTGTITDTNSTLKYGLELAYLAGPLSAEAEYFGVDVDTDSGSDPTFGGYHVQASYVLTGESRGYRNGVFRGVSPAGSRGAWEIAARYSSVDLIDAGLQGGEQQNLTLGVNYYATANIRFMANLILVDVKDSGATVGGSNDPAVIVGDESPNVLALRAQFHF